MHRFFASEFFNFEFLRVLSMTPSSGCDIAEALNAAAKIKDGDQESWTAAFYALAQKTEMLALNAAKNGDRVSARGAFLRVSNYYRASQYMLHDRRRDRDARVLLRAQNLAELFEKGVSMIDTMSVDRVQIPYDKGVYLPGYLYMPLKKGRHEPSRKIPLVTNINGGDSVQEELFYICPSVGPLYGYAILTFDGPGQGMLLRKNRVGMRPDWENVMTPVINWLEEFANGYSGTAQDLDLDRIAILGASMGGYFALRSAAHPRIQACVNVNPAYDMWELATGKLPRWFTDGWLNG